VRLREGSRRQRGEPEKRPCKEPEEVQRGEAEKKRRRPEAAREDGDVFDQIGKMIIPFCVVYSV
jgi:hypothetical protein